MIEALLSTLGVGVYDALHELEVRIEDIRAEAGLGDSDRPPPGPWKVRGFNSDADEES